MFETITPIDNSVLVKREYATEEDIEKILSNSYSVREHWKNISLEERKKSVLNFVEIFLKNKDCLLYTSPSPRDVRSSRMPSSA